jgi:threonine dehydratase
MISLETITQAAQLIRHFTGKTPLVYSATLSRRFNAQIYLKLENLQKTGSFKVRGASHKLILRRREGSITSKGVVAASAGNHAQGVALAAREAGLPAAIVMPTWASISKQEATRNYGGRVILHGATMEESIRHAEDMVASGMTLIHPFDDPDIIAGQGTIALEIMADLPDVDTILVPVGGGGLIAGIASAVKSIRPDVRIVGVESAACPCAQVSMRTGKRVLVTAKSSIADGISVNQLGEMPFEIIQDRVNDVVTVEEGYIAAAIQILLERKKILAEGAGAVPLAALLNKAVQPRKGEKMVLVISGGNVDTPLLGRIIQQGLLKNARIMRIRLTLSDKPGTLADLLQKIAGLEANILHIHHDRSVAHRSIDETSVELELETRNAEHIRAIATALDQAGYQIEPVAGQLCT